MSINWKLAIKYAWFAVMISVGLLGLGSCLVDLDCNYAGLNLLPILVVLSFPASVVFLALIAIFIDPPAIYPSLGFALIWLGTFSVGFIQWFWILPRLPGKSEFTRLGLATTDSAKTESDTKKQPSRSLPIAKSPQKVRAAGVLHFDKQGLTPLERVIYGGSKPRRF